MQGLSCFVGWRGILQSDANALCQRSRYWVYTHVFLYSQAVFVLRLLCKPNDRFGDVVATVWGHPNAYRAHAASFTFATFFIIVRPWWINSNRSRLFTPRAKHTFVGLPGLT